MRICCVVCDQRHLSGEVAQVNGWLANFGAVNFCVVHDAAMHRYNRVVVTCLVESSDDRVMFAAQLLDKPFLG